MTTREGFILVEVDTDRPSDTWRMWIFDSDVDATIFGRKMSRRFEYQYQLRRASVAEIEK